MLKITKLTLTVTYTNWQLPTCVANQLWNRNNLATWESINHQLKDEKSLDLSLGARDKFCR